MEMYERKGNPREICEKKDMCMKERPVKLESEINDSRGIGLHQGSALSPYKYQFDIIILLRSSLRTWKGGLVYDVCRRFWSLLLSGLPTSGFETRP